MRRGRLIAIDGIDGAAVHGSAREALAAAPRSRRGGISHWDASGVFHELAIADGRASPRTLLLLYAADLAFRLRWEINPALEEGRTIVAAPYVRTATAFGRAVGLPSAWLSNLFQFAPRAAETRIAGADRARVAQGFVEVACARWAEQAGVGRERLTREIARCLRPRRAPR